ncbi:type IV pili system adhesin PilY [Thalassotalea insulae]|uniref:Type IV pili system adhesin PilY n=2 Tax=Thalassotalea insulae TaxID=2056778 RepID=A0ABQ6GR49_9GAMM|nr:type IV pili system adhesin PilY [Thalassotalea insulae]
MKKTLLMGMLACLSTMVSSEDIELYISDVVKQSAAKSKVLIIFDNSGSMTTVEEVNDDFDPNEEYAAEAASHAFNDGAIYFNKGGADGVSSIPTSPSDARRFNIDINSCQTAKDILARRGTYTGRIREYRLKGNTGTWEEIPDNNGLNIEVLDCEDDVILERTDADGNLILDGDGNAIIGNPKNADALAEGYPADGLGNKNNPEYHDTDINSAAVKKVDWSGPLVTLYTAKYLRWFYGQSVNKVTKTRLKIAQDSITDVIESTPSIEFGLEVFNYNQGDLATDGNGGRVVMGIRQMTSTNKATLIDIIDNVITAKTWTPLCESVYEASRYFAGAAVDFGDDDISPGAGYTKNKPPADSTIIDGSKNYKAPFDECTSKAFIILVTDGEPTKDYGADSRIEALTSLMPTDSVDSEGDQVFELKKFTEESLTIGSKYSDDYVSNNYLPALAGWMENYDINPDLDGVQTVSTHTIGFSSGADNAKGLLTETAKRGGGSYFQAKTGLQLTQALLGTLRNLEPSNDSLTSASVAANNFDRTETLNSVYYAMFDPQIGPRWQGNLKKYKVTNGVQLGVNSVAAIDEDSGHFSEFVQSYWSSVTDGNKVAEGGVAEWFGTLTDTNQRTLYTDTSGTGSLATFNYSTLETAFTDAAGLATELNVPQDEVADYIAWAMGKNVDDVKVDNSVPNMRPDIFGDPLHSKPLVVNYGDLGEGKSAIRIVIGTNAGALHMFEDGGNSVKENWAFMPTEFLKNIKPLRDNYASADKVYGIDGQITSYFDDIDGNGKVNGSDKMYIIFGLRRGGSSYYALDITNPDSAPILKWHITNSGDFSELGQTWSKPKVAFSKLNASGSGDSAVAKPVVILGGGYDTNKDTSGPESGDSKGRAIYMVDLVSGSLLWSMAPSGATTTFPGNDSIPSSIATLDSDGDGFTDRLYTGDTGGNVWRVDMPGDDKSKWTVFKLASLGSDTAGDDTNDLRFFNEPSIVRTFISETLKTDITDEEGVTTQIVSHQEIPYDAVLIGSGDRSNPLGTDTDDTFFMIKDKNIKTQAFTADSTPKIPTVITKPDLYNYTDNPFGETMTSQARETLELAVSAKDGWYVNFTQDGEKSSASAIVINGVAYFTSFTPPEFSGELIDCKPPTGKGWLYAIDLALGTKIYDWKSEDADNRDDRIAYISEQFLGAPTLIVVPEDDGGETPGDAVGNIIVGRKIIPVGFQLRTMRTYQYVKEEQ